MHPITMFRTESMDEGREDLSPKNVGGIAGVEKPTIACSPCDHQALSVISIDEPVGLDESGENALLFRCQSGTTAAWVTALGGYLKVQ